MTEGLAAAASSAHVAEVGTLLTICYPTLRDDALATYQTLTTIQV